MQELSWGKAHITARLTSGECLRIAVKRNPGQNSMRLQAHPKHGISLSCSSLVSQREIEDFVVAQEEWIERQYIRLLEVHKEREIEASSIPSSIYFDFIGKSFPIDVHTGNRKHAKCSIDFERTKISFTLPEVSISDSDYLALYKEMLLALSKHYLIPYAKALLDKHGLSYSSIEVRNAQSRWGSCNSKKRIMLSSSLLFADPELVDAVIYHEASHLKYMNHGKEYYRELKTYDPKYKKHHGKLKELHAKLPWYCK